METSDLRKDFWIKTIEASFNQGWFSSLQAVAYDSIHQCVAAGGDSGKVSLLSLQTGATQELPSVGDKIRCLAFGIGDELFVGAENGSVARLSVDTGLVELIQKVSDKAITSVAYSVEHGLLVGSDDRRVRLVDPNGLAVRAVSPREGSYVQSVAFADDGALAVSAGCDNRLRVYGIPALDAVQVIYQGGDSQREAVAGHGVCVSGGKDGLISIVRDTDPENLSCLPVSSDEIIAVLVPRSRHSLVTADAKGNLLEWSLEDLRPISALDAECGLKDVALADAGDVLVLCSDSKVRCFLRASAVDHSRCILKKNGFKSLFLVCCRVSFGGFLENHAVPSRRIHSCHRLQLEWLSTSARKNLRMNGAYPTHLSLVTTRSLRQQNASTGRPLPRAFSNASAMNSKGRSRSCLACKKSVCSKLQRMLAAVGSSAKRYIATGRKLSVRLNA